MYLRFGAGKGGIRFLVIEVAGAGAADFFAATLPDGNLRSRSRIAMKKVKDYIELQNLKGNEGDEVVVLSTDLVYRVIRGHWVMVRKAKDGKNDEKSTDRS